jgi:hypothetical protein
MMSTAESNTLSSAQALQVVTLSNDLRGADSADYEDLHDGLCSLGFQDRVVSGSRPSVDLPSSTHVAIVQGSSAAAVKSGIADQIEVLFERLGIHGRCVLSVGTHWALKVRQRDWRERGSDDPRHGPSVR